MIRVAGSTVYNFDNPIRRDVVSIGGGSDNVTFRFVTDNPGPWFMHCHIDWHLEGGLAIVFAEAPENVPEASPASGQLECFLQRSSAFINGLWFLLADWTNLCPSYEQLNPDAQLA